VGGPAVNGFGPWRDSILKCDLKGAAPGGTSFSQLFFLGKRMPLARTPNEDPDDVHGGVWAHAIGSLGTAPKRTLRYGKDIDPKLPADFPTRTAASLRPYPVTKQP